LHDLLEAAGVRVWFSEKDLGLGVPMMRAIDKGLAASRIGLVLVTPALLARLPKESVADKELSALLARNRLVPIVHNTTYEALRNVSPLLASRSGLDTAEDSMAVVARENRRAGHPLALIAGISHKHPYAAAAVLSRHRAFAFSCTHCYQRYYYFGPANTYIAPDGPLCV
jgi:hypothetical protein